MAKQERKYIRLIDPLRYSFGGKTYMRGHAVPVFDPKTYHHLMGTGKFQLVDVAAEKEVAEESHAVNVRPLRKGTTSIGLKRTQIQRRIRQVQKDARTTPDPGIDFAELEAAEETDAAETKAAEIDTSQPGATAEKTEDGGGTQPTVPV